MITKVVTNPMNWRSAFSVVGSGKSRTWSRFSGVKDVPVLEIRCSTYSTSLSPRRVFRGFAVTLFSRSRKSTLRKFLQHSSSVVPWTNTSSIYISHMHVTYPASTLLDILRCKKGPDPLRPMATLFHSNSPYWVMKAVYSCESGWRGIYDAKHFGFQCTNPIYNLLNVGYRPSF